MKKNLPNRRTAFSLIELLLALSIFSVIALSLYSTFAAGLSLSRRSEQTDEVYRQVRWTLEKVSAELENMVNYDFSSSYSDQLAFVGDEDKVTFIVPAQAGLKVVAYYLQPLDFGSVYKTMIGKHYSRNVDMVFLREQRADLEALLREEVDFVDYLSAVSPETKDVSVLHSKIKKGGLKFLYAYREVSGEEVKIVWKDKWDQKGIPAALQVELTFIDPERQEPVSVRKNIFIPTGVFGQVNL